MNTYGYTKQVTMPYTQAVAAIKYALKEQGFGVLSEIDVKETLKAKTGKEIEPYVILGACNPEYAHQALEMEKELGLLLPCNVIVYEHEGDVYVSSIDPEVLLGVTGNKELISVAEEVKSRLQVAVNTLE